METIKSYIATFPEEVQAKLFEIREIIQSVAPECEEVINYGIPTFKMHDKNLVHYGGFKKHIGFYPTPSGIIEFKDQLSAYNGSKGSVQFPLGQPLPVYLIQQIVRFRLKEMTQK